MEQLIVAVEAEERTMQEDRQLQYQAPVEVVL
jgi:hypothetical protein